MQIREVYNARLDPGAFDQAKTLLSGDIISQAGWWYVWDKVIPAKLRTHAGAHLGLPRTVVSIAAGHLNAVPRKTMRSLKKPDKRLYQQVESWTPYFWFVGIWEAKYVPTSGCVQLTRRKLLKRAYRSEEAAIVATLRSALSRKVACFLPAGQARTLRPIAKYESVSIGIAKMFARVKMSKRGREALARGSVRHATLIGERPSQNRDLA
jgi:hypothetical protein